jgi:hypothetical protein
MPRVAHKQGLLLGAALLVAVGATLWPGAPQTQVTAVVAPAVSQGAAVPREHTFVAEPESLRLETLRERQPRRNDVADLFSPDSWQPPPPPPGRAEPAPAPPPQMAEPPPAPRAPDFPYTLAGSVIDAEGPMVVFSKQNQDFVLRMGEVLEQNYRVEKIEPESVTLTYLPLGLAQRVALPGAQ